MKDLYLLRYNNYINRKVKLPKTLTQYQAYQVGNTLLNTNFYSADGIHANQTVNLDFDILGAIPDYAVITVGGSDEILEHWYILEANKIRKGQYDLTLRRDTILDYKDIIMRAKSVIARGTVAQSNPLIYNSEDSHLNVIKKSEILLKDQTQMPWIVGYISQDVAIDAGTVNIKSYEQVDYDYPNIMDHPFYKYTELTSTNEQSFLAVSYQRYTGAGPSATVPGTLDLKLSPINIPQHNRDLYYSPSQKVLHTTIELEPYALQDAQNRWNELSPGEKQQIIDANPQETITVDQYNEIANGQNKIIKTKYGNYTYKVINDGYVIGSYVAPIFVPVVNGILTEPNWTGPLKTENVRYVNFSFHLEFTQCETNTRVKYKVVFTGRDLTNKTSPYGIITMPYIDDWKTLVTQADLSKGQLMTKSQRLKIFQGLGAYKDLVYDIQILPYCPLSTLRLDPQSREMYNIPGVKTVPIYDEKGILATNMYVADTGEFHFTISQTVNAKDIKTTNECDIWRLVSPNGASNFEFNASKFGIHTAADQSKYFVNTFNVDCSYRPYQPYIHIAPKWDGLYGKDYNDPRGLICAGDFSTDRVSDQWESYQYNNKNFQLQFDRQIETMEFNKRMGWLGPIGGMIGGAAGLANVAGVPDWLAGGAWRSGLSPMGVRNEHARFGIGTPFDPIETVKPLGVMAGSLAVGIAQHMRHNEAIAARKDDFNWTNQNIDARPYGLTKVSVLNNNNKLFPYLEYYSCTPEEQEQVQLRMTLQGMTVGAIGKIEDYLNLNKDGTHKYPPANGLYNRNYIRATIIEIPEAVSDDAHLVMAINEELAEGVYFEE